MPSPDQSPKDKYAHLTEKQRKRAIAKENKIKYQKQQNSISLLVSPSQKDLQAIKNEIKDAKLYGPKKPNQGLSIVAEHPVVTRQMRAGKISKSPKKMEGWQAEDLAQIANKKKIINRDFSNTKSNGSDIRGDTSMFWHDHNAIDITNYQHSKLEVESNNQKGFKRMQNHIINKERQKNAKSNRDLEVDAAGSATIINDNKSVLFTENKSSLSGRKPTHTFMSDKRQMTSGILKAQSNFNNTQDFIKTQNSRNKDNELRKTESNLRFENNQVAFAVGKDDNLNKLTSSFKNKKSPNTTRKEAPLPMSDTNQDLDIFNTIKVNQPRVLDHTTQEAFSTISGPQNSHWAGLTGLPGMGVAMGGPGYRPGDKTIKDSLAYNAMRRVDMLTGKAPPKYKGKLAFRNVAPTNQEERFQDIELVMQNIVFKYTRQELGTLSQRDSSPEVEGDLLNTGVMSRQVNKEKEMRKKLNRSVDLATMKQNLVLRQQEKYSGHPIYKKVSNTLYFNSDAFMQAIEEATDLSQSPMPPSKYINVSQEQNIFLNVKQTNSSQADALGEEYSTKLPNVDDFIKPKIPHYGSISQISPMIHQKLAALQHQQAEGTEFIPPNNMILISENNTVSGSTPINASGKMTQEVSRQESLHYSPNIRRTQNNSKMQSIEGSLDQGYTHKTTVSKGLTTTEDFDDEARAQVYELFKNDDDEIENLLDDKDVSAEKTAKKVLQFQCSTVSTLIHKLDQRAVSFRYDIKMPKHQTDGSKLEGKLKEEAEQRYREEMKQSERAFKLIKEYCREQLSVSDYLLNKHIDDLLNAKTDVSPLLKYFNDLARHTNFRMPCKSLLEFDQKFFRKCLERIREGHRVELNWIQKQVVNTSRKLCMEAFDQARQCLQKEAKQIIYEYEQMKAELKTVKEQNLELQKKIEHQQNVIVEQRTYLNNYVSKIFADDRELFVLNGGPGGNYDKVVKGEVIQNFDEYYDQLHMKVEYAALLVKESMQNQMSSNYKKFGLITQNDKDSKSNTNSRMSQYSQGQGPPATAGTLPSVGFRKLDNVDNFMPSQQEALTRLEPFLKKEFKMFGGYISCRFEDQAEVLTNELYKYYKIEHEKLLKNVQVLKAENEAQCFVLHEINSINDALRDDNNRQIVIIDQLKNELEILKTKQNERIEKAVDKIKQQSKEDMAKLKAFMTYEVQIATLIKDKMIDENQWQSEKLKKFATLLRIPRYHFDYIEKHGVNEFVEFCEDVVKRERLNIEEKQMKQMRMELRNESKLSQICKSHRPYAERIEDQRKEVRFNSPFQLNLKLDSRRDDHPSHMKTLDRFELEDMKVLKHLNEVNWLKNKSVLDLSDLIRRHMDRQPELLALIQPDIKKNLLYNPQLMKTLDQLERKDPINQRVKEIKDFIQTLKQDTFGAFTQVDLQNADQRKISRLRNNLSQSVVVEDSKALKMEFSNTNTLMNTETKRSLLDSYKISGKHHQVSPDNSKIVLASVNDEIRSSSIMLQPFNHIRQSNKEIIAPFRKSNQIINNKNTRNAFQSAANFGITEQFKTLKVKNRYQKNISPQLLSNPDISNLNNSETKSPQLRTTDNPVKRDLNQESVTAIETVTTINMDNK